ncbi:ABC transporter substrate-binding protein [Deinococcus ruber]|uniref:Sugar ABC transporter substrate-binding protein n=1 Tax=Deinococcus ruber TaxID=1848197 RepID=A0A918CHM6_9DEIO|nr:sugar ABC transporter substrate-binding protein [Deinococcus ruber]GGR25562.1 sugar ABC transporter substrate-binding protein [Deinococcus ruber]
MKKAVLALSLALAGSSILGLASAAVTQSPVSIDFWTFYLAPKFDGYINGVIADFQKAHPDIKVNYIDKQGTLEQELITNISLGTSPDVVNLWVESTQKAADSGLLTDMGALVPNAKALYYPNSLSNFTVGGKLYGLPWYASFNAGVMAYNNDLIKKAGLTTLPKTTAQMVAFAKTIKDKTGAYGWAPAIKDPQGGSFLGVFAGEGLPLLNGNTAAFNSPAHAKLLQTYIDLYKADYIPQDLLRKEAFQLSQELYTQGKLATIIGGPQALNRVRDNNKAIYAASMIADAPVGAGRTQAGGGMDLVIPKAAKHPKEALMFAQYMTNRLNQVAFAKIVPIVPTAAGSNLDPAFAKLKASKDPIEKATGMIAANGPSLKTAIPPLKNATDLFKAFDDNIEAAFLGRKTAQAALNDAADAWNKLLK